MGGRSTTSSSPRPVVGADAPAQGGRTGRGPAAGGRRRGRAESPPNASVEREPARHHAITSPAPRGRPSPGRRAPRVDPVLAGMLLSCVVADAWFLLAPVDTGLDIRLYWLVQPPMDVALSLLSQRVSRLPGLPVPARRFWNLMVLAGVLFAAGDTTQAVVAMTGQADLAARPGLVQQACVILGTGVLLLWLVFHPTGMGSRWAWLSFWLDGVTMMAAAAVFVWYFSFPPAMDTRAAAGAVLGSGVLLVAVSAMVKLILSGASPMTPGPARSCSGSSRTWHPYRTNRHCCVANWPRGCWHRY